MIDVKNLLIKNISAKDANGFVKKNHYSKKVVPNSQIHFGVFFNNQLSGVLQFGPCMRKEFMLGLVKDTKWNDFLELNRMVFLDALPKNSESRSIAVCLRLIKKHAPNIKWIVTFADATQCGDGTIYRATGAYLTNIKKNVGLKRNNKTGEVLQQMTAYHNMITDFGNKDVWQPLDGYQIRYIWLLDKKAELLCDVLDYKEIEIENARMYKGKKCST